jgi:hypothetical protein
MKLLNLEWHAIRAALNADGVATIPGLLDAKHCVAMRERYDDGGKTAFRSRVVMQRHGYGRGEYRYFDYPLPPLVQALRERVYPQLVPLANSWAERLGESQRYPETHAEFVERCAAAGQLRPTPLLLRYGPGDYNCLHQDLYGEHAFPLQMVVLLSAPQEEFSGGEFLLVEQRPRMQSRARVVPLQRGDAAIFAVHRRPVAGSRGDYRVMVRHGVSELRSGGRSTLGVIFHDAR